MMKHLLFLMLAAAPIVSADAVYNITLNTGPLSGNPLGPFQLDFQFLDGDGAANNTILLRNFTFGAGGSASGIPALIGGASGSLGTSVALTDSSFFNAFTAGFTPGTQLSFVLETTTNFAGGTPDQFSFGILDNTGSYLPTSFFDVFVTFDLNGAASPVVFTGSNALTGAPAVTPESPSAVPEPSTWAMALLGIAAVASGAVRRRRN